MPGEEAAEDGLELELELPALDGAMQDSPNPVSDRLARWTRMIEGEETAMGQQWDSTTTLASTTTSALSMLALACHRNTKTNRTTDDEINDFANEKAKQPGRNIFSKAARFSRRNRRKLEDN